MQSPLTSILGSTYSLVNYYFKKIFLSILYVEGIDYCSVISIAVNLNYSWSILWNYLTCKVEYKILISLNRWKNPIIFSWFMVLCHSKIGLLKEKRFMCKGEIQVYYIDNGTTYLKSCCGMQVLWFFCTRCPLYRRTVPVWWRRLYLPKSTLWLCCPLCGWFRWIQL